MYTFHANTIDEVITAAGVIGEDEQAYITAAQLREGAKVLIAVRDDLAKCHELCKELGAPDLGGGTFGLVKRLEFLKNNRQEQ